MTLPNHYFTSNEEMDTSRNWYADDESIAPMLDALKTVLSMVQTSLNPAIQPMILQPNAFTVDYNDDEALKSYIRSDVVSEMHLQGTMKMGTDQDPMAVVDNELKLIGSNGRVRVADTSIFPSELRGHPMAAAMAVGMKAAEMMANDASVSSDTAEMNEGEVGNGDGTDTEAKEDTSGGCSLVVATTAAATTCAFAATLGV